MNNITVEHLLELVSQIIPGSTYDYARPGANKARLISVDIASTKIQIARVSGDGTLTQSSIASDSLNTLASRIVEDTPISIDEALLNGGNQRSVIEALLLRTAEFYSCKVGRNKNIVWVPSRPHKIGEHLEINLSDLHPDSSFDSILDNISELFAAYLKNEGKSEATVDRYVKQVPNNSEVQNIVQAIADTTVLFDVMDVTKLLQISQKVAAQDFDKNGGNMYSAGINAFTHFISNYRLFVKHLAKRNKNAIGQNSNPSNFPLPPIVYDSSSASDTSKKILSALRTKPFVLLAGISGTGKSRLVRELARACWKPDSEEYKDHKPKNFEMLQVKPNWHDSTELLGYVSRISGTPEFVAGDFLRFIAKAWENLDTPHFLCLDEMNLAPVEQYFAEYLSVVESRKFEDGKIVTDPIIKPVDAEWYKKLVRELTKVESIQEDFIKGGIPLPPNLFVIGTVNMDETTYSFSRKVLDRAMTIEMNEVDLNGGLDKDTANEFDYIGDVLNHIQAVGGKDVYGFQKDLCDKVVDYLKEVNDILDKTPFKIAYRTRNEFLVYAVNRQLLAGEGSDTLNSALDEMTSMKILSRIEGDAAKTETVLKGLDKLLKDKGFDEKGISLSKIKEMQDKLMATDYCSFWS